MNIVKGASYVVDTNVARTADGEATQADFACMKTCLEAVNAVVQEAVVVVDDDRRILREYEKAHRKRQRFSPPGLVYQLLKHVHNHQYRGERVRRVRITAASEDRGFEELPPNDFDDDDRMFLATAVVGKAEVLNAVDSDWELHRCLTDCLDVRVQQLCPWLPSKSKAKG